jgi:Zn-dependent peptidase ImmA (M78 family)
MNFAEREGIKVEYFEFHQLIKVVYLAEPDMPPLIGLNTLITNVTELRCVLAEGLGIHFTTSDYLKYQNLTNQLNISKLEHGGLIWATKYLIPLKELHIARQSGLQEICELAKHFNVTEDMIKFRLRLNDIELDFEPNIILIDGQEPKVSEDLIFKYPNAISVIDAGRPKDEILDSLVW